MTKEEGKCTRGVGDKNNRNGYLEKLRSFLIDSNIQVKPKLHIQRQSICLKIKLGRAHWPECYWMDVETKTISNR